MNKESCISILKLYLKDEIQHLQDIQEKAKTCKCDADHKEMSELAKDNLETIHQAFDYLELNLK